MASTLEDVAAVQRRLDEVRAIIREMQELETALVAALEVEKRLATKHSLPDSHVKSRVNKQKMHSQHKLAISEGRAAKRDTKFKETINKAKFTQASLAGAVGMKASLLSMCRAGERAMFLSRAKRVAELTGWPADKAHWPGGIIEDA